MLVELPLLTGNTKIDELGRLLLVAFVDTVLKGRLRLGIGEPGVRIEDVDVLLMGLYGDGGVASALLLWLPEEGCTALFVPPSYLHFSPPSFLD